jgi:hypothetical protein
MNKYRVDQAQEAYWPPCGKQVTQQERKHEQ